MNDVLPGQAGLVVNGVIYNYTVTKNKEDDLLVHIQNESLDPEAGQYIFRSTDDWSGRYGATINKFVGVNNIPATSFGNGSIEKEGIGDISNPSVAYSYKFNECYYPLTNPECPGYIQALYDWLKENGLLDAPPNPGDPYYDEWVQATLNRETFKEEEIRDKEEKDKDIQKLNHNASIEKLASKAQQNNMIDAMANVPGFDSYYNVAIQGGVYNDALDLKDSTLPDNKRAMRSLASDKTHRQMVRSQYEK